MRIQCKSNVHRSRPHSALCGTEFVDFKWPHLHTATTAPLSDLYFRQQSIASRVEQIRGTQCVAGRSALTVGSQHEHACHALFGPHVQRAIARSSSIQIETTSGSGLGLIQTRSGLGECTFSVDAFKLDSIRFNVHWVSSVDAPYMSCSFPYSHRHLLRSIYALSL